MLSKKQKNIFTYQGLKSLTEIRLETKNKKSLIFDFKILENNLTKSFLITLIHSKIAKYEFLKLLKKKSKIFRSMQNMQITENNVDLNTNKIITNKRLRSILLLISSKYSKEIIINEQDKEENRILDAFISGNRINIGIEVKLHSSIDRNQLEDERNQINARKILKITWEEIHSRFNNAFSNLSNKNKNNEIILKNFIELLEVLNMYEFEKIDPTELDEEKIKDYYEKIIDKIQNDKSLRYLETDNRSKWVNLYERNSNSNLSHYSFGCDFDKFRIDLVIRNKELKNLKNIFKSKEKIQKQEKIINLLKKLHNKKTGKWYLESEHYKNLNPAGVGPQRMSDAYKTLLAKMNLQENFNDNEFENYISKIVLFQNNPKQINIFVELRFADKNIKEINYALIRKNILFFREFYKDLKKII